MKLVMVGGSPFARKVRVAAAERGLAERLDIVIRNPHASPPELIELNPLSKVPVLIADDGTPHADSLAICLYLDSLGEAPPLLPPQEPGRSTVLQRHVLANGMMDCTVLRRVESLRAPEPDRLAVMARQKRITEWTLGRFEDTLPGFAHLIALDTVTLGCALSYLDFRFPEDEWRTGRPRLAEWHAAFAERASMQGTEYFQ